MKTALKAKTGVTLAKAIAALGSDEYLRLPGLGWLKLKRFGASESRHPTTGAVVRVPGTWGCWFLADDVFKAAINHLSPPTSAPVDELARLTQHLHPDGSPKTAETLRIRSTSEAQLVADAVVAALTTDKKSSVLIDSLGTFELVPKGLQKLARFVPAAELRSALARKE